MTKVANSTEKQIVNVKVNGKSFEWAVEPRMLLSDFLRQELGLTGTHVGCEHGKCGACNIFFDGKPVRSCLMFAIQADGHEIKTIEGVAKNDEELHPVQQAFIDNHGLQCGFCTPGMVIAACALLEENPKPSEDEIRNALSGNICRCTGYTNIVKAVQEASERIAAG